MSSVGAGRAGGGNPAGGNFEWMPAIVLGKTDMNLKRVPIWSGEVSMSCADRSCDLTSSLLHSGLHLNLGALS